jgi:hypothetical protein
MSNDDDDTEEERFFRENMRRSYKRKRINQALAATLKVMKWLKKEEMYVISKGKHQDVEEKK